MLDALDEADKPPAPHHPSGSSGRPASSHGSSSASAPSALDNKVLQLLLHQLSQLPRCVRILTTTRPEKHLVEPLRSRWVGRECEPKGVSVGPHRDSALALGNTHNTSLQAVRQTLAGAIGAVSRRSNTSPVTPCSLTNPRFRGGLLELVPSQLRRMEKTQAGMQVGRLCVDDKSLPQRAP